MKKVLYFNNLPSPYRVDFLNELGKSFDVTALFEAGKAEGMGIRFNWNLDSVRNFRVRFLSEGELHEKRVNWSVIPFFRKNRFDEIILTNYSYFTAVAALIYIKFHHIPYYMETDGGFIRSDEKGLKKKIKTFLLSGAKGYFSPSDESDDYLVYYGAERSRIHRYPFTSLWQRDILPEVLSAEEKQICKKRLGMEEEKAVLGVGQFIYRKGWDVLLRAAAKFPEYGVYIVGGSVPQEYSDLREKLHLGNVHFRGFKSGKEIAEYYRAADVFVLPTREDIWGLVINEAMGYGLPVITTDRCLAGLALVANGKNGYIVSAGKAGPLAESVRLILGNEETAARMSEVSLRRIKAYTVENMAAEHKKILDSDK